MKKSAILAVSILVLVGVLAAVPAFADSTLYDNTGPTSNGGSTDPGAWTINFGFVVSDSFTLSSSSTVTGADFLIWLSPGDTLSSVDWSIGTTEYDTSLGSATATTSSLGETNSGVFGDDIFNESISISSLPLDPGTTYWFTLQDASVPSGDPAYWDVSNGHSVAYENTFGNVYNYDLNGDSNSDTFQILGTTAATPEPSSFLLLGSGLAGLAGLIKRKLMG
jgi:hypothetical protein